MQAFILAGGFATRLWPLTEKRAKPLLPLAGKPLISHIVESIPDGIEITVSTNLAFKQDFENWKKTMSGKHINILIEDSGNEDEKLGALGAVSKWVTESSISDDVLLLAGDNYMGFSVESFVSSFDGSPLVASYDIREVELAKMFGTVVVDKEDQSFVKKVVAFEEKPNDPKSTLVSTGCTIIPGDKLSELVCYAKDHPDNIGGIFEHFLSSGIDVKCMSFSDLWFDIGSFDAYLDATRVLVGDTVSSENGNEFSGSVVVGAGSSVKNSKLKDVVIFEGCEVTDCVLENCILDNACNLKGIDLKGKMLREGTKLVR